MAATRNPGALAGATGVGKPNQASAEGTQQIAQKPERKEAGTPYVIQLGDGEPFEIEVSGRDKWALDRLWFAGSKGCTPIADPAPRWSAYVCNLRALGVEIETMREAHGGPFAGHHARYLLRCEAKPGRIGGAA